VIHEKIYLESHKDKMFCPYGFGLFFCPLRFLAKYGHVRLQTLYLQVNTSILWVHPNLVGNMAAFVARFGYPITTPNLLHLGLKFLFWRLSKDVRTRCCQRISTTLHYQKPKYAIEKKAITSKTHNGQKKLSIRFSRCIYKYMSCCVIATTGVRTPQL
jgi:hypothetical protein